MTETQTDSVYRLEFLTNVSQYKNAKYCQRRFSCAIRNETVTIRFSEKSPRCSPSEIPILVFFLGGGGDLM